MDAVRKTTVLKGLRAQIQRLERAAGRLPSPDAGLRFGIPAVDHAWGNSGLPVAALHEARADTIAGFAAASAFAGAIAGRLQRTVLWCTTRTDFYGPGLAQIGLPPSRLIVVRARTETEVLAVMEEGLRHAVLGCVIGETTRLGLTESRRLQLAAEKTGTMAFVVRKPRAVTLDAIAAASRWHVSAVPSAPHPIPEAGRPRWKLELLRSRSGNTGSWIVDVPDAQGHMRLSSPLADRIEAAPVAARHLATG